MTGLFESRAGTDREVLWLLYKQTTLKKSGDVEVQKVITVQWASAQCQ